MKLVSGSLAKTFSLALFWATLSSMVLSSVARAETIGLSLPLSGRYAPVAEKVLLGARLALEEAVKTQSDISLQVEDDACSPDTANKVGANLFAAKIIIGPMCFDTARQLAEVSGKNVIALNTSSSLLSRARQYSQLPLYSLSNAPNSEALAMIENGIAKFGNRPFAILDDGSLHGRSLADNIRLLGEQVGKKPIALANFRPLQSNQRALLRRMIRSGVQAIIIAGEAEDITTISADMRDLKLDWPILIGEQAQLLAFAENAKAVALNTHIVQSHLKPLINADGLLAKLKELDQIPHRSIFEGYALVQIATQFLANNEPELGNQSFETILGTLQFGQDGRASHAPYALQQWNGRNFTSESVN